MTWLNDSKAHAGITTCTYTIWNKHQFSFFWYFYKSGPWILWFLLLSISASLVILVWGCAYERAATDLGSQWPGQDQIPDTNLSQYFYAPHSYMSHVLTSNNVLHCIHPGLLTCILLYINFSKSFCNLIFIFILRRMNFHWRLLPS